MQVPRCILLPKGTVGAGAQSTPLPKGTAGADAQRLLLPKVVVFAGRRREVLPKVGVFAGLWPAILPNIRVFGGGRRALLPRGRVVAGLRRALLPKRYVAGSVQSEARVGGTDRPSGRLIRFPIHFPGELDLDTPERRCIPWGRYRAIAFPARHGSELGPPLPRQPAEDSQNSLRVFGGILRVSRLRATKQGPGAFGPGQPPKRRTT